MKYVILLILGVMWAGVGISWLRSRTGPRGTNSISAFSNHLTVLARTSPARSGLGVVDNGAVTPAAGRAPYAPQVRLSRAQAQKRRRDVLFGLAGAFGASTLLAVAVGGIFVPLAVLTLALLGGYVALLIRMQKVAAERRAKVRYLPQPAARRAEGGEVLLLQRSAN